jgi:predicted amidophosphoribosyltransferase
MLLATTCPVCGVRGAAPCADCLARLRPPPALPPPSGVDDCRALLAYEGAGRDLVARLKYRNHRVALPGLARAAAGLVLASEVDVVTWAPTVAAHRRARGFDQAALIARNVASTLRRPCTGLLVRCAGPAQTGQPASARWAGPRFRVRHPCAANVLVIDDVITTGATVAAAARALREAGAARVVVLALARTPSRRPRSVTK